jgi:hypothetical protein
VTDHDATAEPSTDPSAEIDALVGEWLTLPDLAEALGTDVGKARRILQDRRVVGMRRGERATFQVPARFLVPLHLIEPANARQPSGDGRLGVLMSLQGTIAVLTDAGFRDDEIIGWLFRPDEELGESPIDALAAGRKSHVRRIAQSLA